MISEMTLGRSFKEDQDSKTIWNRIDMVELQAISTQVHTKAHQSLQARKEFRAITKQLMGP